MTYYACKSAKDGELPSLFYATLDAENGVIKPDADIQCFHSEAEAVTYLKRPFGTDWNHDTIEIAAGHWWDCWQKRMDEPDENSFGFGPFNYDELDVLNPGQHPGGRFFWVTPRPDVLCIHYIESKEEI